MGSDDSYGNCGTFRVSIPTPDRTRTFPAIAIASDQEGWEHVSVVLEGRKRTPNWDEMSYIKSLFWDEEDWVVQFHPAKSSYVNNHPYCLHLWRSTDQRMPNPDSILVGYR